MGKRVSYIETKDDEFYLLNIPYMDFFILRTMLKGTDGTKGIANEYPLNTIKEMYEKKYKQQPSNSLWSQATNRLAGRGIIAVSRREQLYIAFMSAHIRLQLEKVLQEMKSLEILVEKHRLIKADFERSGA